MCLRYARLSYVITFYDAENRPGVQLIYRIVQLVDVGKGKPLYVVDAQ